MVEKKKATTPTRVTLGVTYEDSISGFTGVAIERYTSKNGCVQVALQPRLGEDPSKMPEAVFVFETQLVVPGTQETINSTPDPKALALLGKRYVDTKSGYAGVAGSHRELLNGTIQLALTPKVDEKGAMGKSWSIDIPDLECIAVSSTPAGTAPRGGPNRESPTF